MGTEFWNGVVVGWAGGGMLAVAVLSNSWSDLRRAREALRFALWMRRHA